MKLIKKIIIKEAESCQIILIDTGHKLQPTIVSVKSNLSFVELSVRKSIPNIP